MPDPIDVQIIGLLLRAHDLAHENGEDFDELVDRALQSWAPNNDEHLRRLIAGE